MNRLKNSRLSFVPKPRNQRYIEIDKNLNLQKVHKAEIVESTKIKDINELEEFIKESSVINYSIDVSIYTSPLEASNSYESYNSFVKSLKVLDLRNKSNKKKYKIEIKDIDSNQVFKSVRKLKEFHKLRKYIVNSYSGLILTPLVNCNVYNLKLWLIELLSNSFLKKDILVLNFLSISLNQTSADSSNDKDNDVGSNLEFNNKYIKFLKEGYNNNSLMKYNILLNLLYIPNKIINKIIIIINEINIFLSFINNIYIIVKKLNNNTIVNNKLLLSYNNILKKYKIYDNNMKYTSSTSMSDDRERESVMDINISIIDKEYTNNEIIYEDINNKINIKCKYITRYANNIKKQLNKLLNKINNYQKIIDKQNNKNKNKNKNIFNISTVGKESDKEELRKLIGSILVIEIQRYKVNKYIYIKDIFNDINKFKYNKCNSLINVYQSYIQEQTDLRKQEIENNSLNSDLQLIQTIFIINQQNVSNELEITNVDHTEQNGIEKGIVEDGGITDEDSEIIDDEHEQTLEDENEERVEYEVIYPFIGENQNELTVLKGEKLFQEKDDQDLNSEKITETDTTASSTSQWLWLSKTSSLQQKGYVPLTHLKQVIDN